jgi:hypothetical protein
MFFIKVLNYEKFRVLIGLMMFFQSNIAQENGQSQEPKGKWKVSKEYDDQGNMISYDSVYVWSSGPIGRFDFFKPDSTKFPIRGFIRDFEMPKWESFENDSIRFAFKDFFNGFEFPEFDHSFQWSPFESDSLFSFRKDNPLFSIEPLDLRKELESMRKQLDKLQEEFDKQQKSEATEPKKIKERKI